MARFFDAFPDLRKKGALMSKHGTLVCEIGKQIETRREGRRTAITGRRITLPPPALPAATPWQA